MALPTKGEADKMKSGGPDESFGTHGNHPQRAGWEDGHQLNESYKIPNPNPNGRPNYSYMHPHVKPGQEWAPNIMGKDPAVSEEKELTTKAPRGMSGKIVFPPKMGKNKT